MLNYYDSVFFKMDTLSEFFVTLSVLRWHFFTPFRTLKNSIFATFPVVLPACPAWSDFELFSPKQLDSFEPGRTQAIPAHFPSLQLFQGILRR